MGWANFSTFLLCCLCINVRSEVYDLNALLHTELQVGGKNISALVSMAAPLSYVLSSYYVRNCKNGKDRKAYDPKSPRLYGAKWNWYNFLMEGDVYSEKVELFGKQWDTFHFGVLKKETPSRICFIDGAIGLNLQPLPKPEDNTFHQLVAGKPEQLVILQAGLPFWSEKSPKGGKIAFGEANIDQCNPPPVYHKTAGGKYSGQWVLEANFTIGTDILPDYVIRLDVAGVTTIPEPYYTTYFYRRARSKNDPDSFPFPTLRFSVDEHTYFAVEDDYSLTDELYNDTSPMVTSHSEAEVIIGHDFLANYCLFLKVDGTGQYVGIGQVKGKERDEPPPDEPLPSTTPTTAILSTTTVSAAVKFCVNSSTLVVLLLMTLLSRN